MSRIDARNGALGIVPQSLDGALVTNDFPLFNLNSDLILSGYLDLHCKTPQFVNLCSKASEGTTNRVRLKEAEFLRSEIDLPSLENQKKIVSQLDTIKGKLQAASALQEGIDKDVEKLLAERFQATLNGAAWRSMREVAPLVKRQVDLEPNRLYKELGARSFGKGLFIKPDFDSATATWEKPVWIKAGDLVFSNIKAWEGAIGVALPEHDGYIASHRYLTAVAKPEFILADYLLHFLLTEQGLLAVNEASPGTADRNRTTKKSVLEMIQVPVPPIAVQRHFIALKNKLVQAAIERTKQKTLTEALIPSMLSKLLTT
jgi:type I restriction enzyme S subunit